MRWEASKGVGLRPQCIPLLTAPPIKGAYAVNFSATFTGFIIEPSPLSEGDPDQRRAGVGVGLSGAAVLPGDSMTLFCFSI